MKPRFKIMIAMAIFGTVAIFVKNIPLSPGEISLYRAVIASTTIIIMKYKNRSNMNIEKIKKDMPLLFISGAIMGFNWIFLFQSYNYTTVSIATLSYYFAPVIIMLLCPIIFKERLTLRQIIYFIMTTIGLVLIIGVSKSDGGDSDLQGIIYGLIAAILYSAVIIINKYIKDTEGVDRTLLQFFAAIIVIIPYVIKTSGINIMDISNIGLINLLILGVFHTGFTYSLYFSYIKYLKGQEVAILSYVDPLVTIILSVVILGETINGIQILGGVMILGFTLLNELDTYIGQIIKNISKKQI